MCANKGKWIKAVLWIIINSRYYSQLLMQELLVRRCSYRYVYTQKQHADKKLN
jgi:hypothetical protein